MHGIIYEPSLYGRKHTLVLPFSGRRTVFVAIFYWVQIIKYLAVLCLEIFPFAGLILAALRPAIRSEVKYYSAGAWDQDLSQGVKLCRSSTTLHQEKLASSADSGLFRYCP